MLNEGRRRRARCYLLALVLGLVGPAPKAQDAPTRFGVGPKEGPCDGESAVALQSQVEDLGQRLLGMEGKLKESAAARKAADQARMEAERRLAEGTQELTRLKAEVGLLRDANLALEARLQRAEGRGGQQPPTEAGREPRAAPAERDAPGRRLDGLPLVGPETEARGLTLQEAQAEAAAAAEALRVAIVQAQGSRDGDARRAVRESAQDLQRRQVRVARLMQARSVYRVIPGDSLTRIAGRFYGDARRWTEIQEANPRVVWDPSHLLPGMTLVIP